MNRSFTTGNPGEVIFLWVKYLTYYPIPNNGEVTEKRWDEATTQTFFAQMRRINNRCKNLNATPKFNERPLKDFRVDGKGCVIIILDGSVRSEVTTLSVIDGIYDGGYFDRDDNWSETNDAEVLVEKQTTRWQGNRVATAGDKDKFLISQWIATQTALESVFGYGLEVYAVYIMNPILYSFGFRAMSPQSYPSVILHDYVGVILKGQRGWSVAGSEIRILAMGINLYMASNNCNVNKRKHPLFKVKASSSRIAAPWNGIVYANGTVVDNPPRDFDPWRQTVLRNGTVFANGTVVKHDIKAPDWSSDQPWANTTILPQQGASNGTTVARAARHLHARHHKGFSF